MSMLKKRALLACGCGCGNACPGCCFPTIDDGTNFPPLPFCIDAPGCPAIDGQCDEFTDDAIEPQNKLCGSCGSFSTLFVLEVPGGFWNPDGMGGCDFVGGEGEQFRFSLFCDAEMGIPDATSENICCRRLRLIVGTNYETIYSDPSFVFPDLGPYITIIDPTSCSCDPFAVTFNLCRCVPKPQTNPSPECPFAPGFNVPECDVCGINLVI